MGQRLRTAVTGLAVALAAAMSFVPVPFAAADEGGASPSAEGPALAAPDVLPKYLEALAKKRLLAAETGSAAALRALVQRGERLYLEGRYDAASLVLFEVVESPKFTDFAEETEFRGAEFMLGRSLAKLGALRTALRYFERVLERGPEDAYFGPAYRAFVDVALEGADLDGAAARLDGLAGKGKALSEDAQNELHYLKGRARFDAGDADGARTHFEAITKTSRFYANGHYLRGVMAAKAGDLKRAEGYFCAVATAGKDERYSFYVDQRFFEVKDLAHLALGRVAHEGGRSEDAFYYYFQVPQDSERVAEAMFEAAYAMYEGGDHETAVDLLDQLEARYPNSAFVDEAKLLRGYIHLGRCEFEEADKLFVGFHRSFQPILDEVNRILESPARQSGLFESLLVEERYEAERRAKGDQDDESVGSLLLALLRVDPRFYRLHADVRVLDAEAARAGRLVAELEALDARVEGKGAPKPTDTALVAWDEGAELRGELEGARSVLRSLGEQLDAMRRSKARPDEVRVLDVALVELSAELGALDRKVGVAIRGAGAAVVAAPATAPATEGDLHALLQADRERALSLPAAVEDVRAELVMAGNAAALASLKALKDRLSKGLRRSRIGRIDAVMGSKRRIEVQIESLAAGRFPPELLDPLRTQGLLRDDEEYWPFEGELWEDEFREREADE